jgi:hypothetical protein
LKGVIRATNEPVSLVFDMSVSGIGNACPILPAHSLHGEGSMAAGRQK